MADENKLATYPGQELGRPESGIGSIAPVGRRVLAFILDWYLCFGVLALAGLADQQLLVLAAFFLYQTLTVGFSGHTLGHLLLGMQVQTLTGKPVGYATAALRALLVMLFIPVVIMDSNQRGLHDQVRGSVLVRIR